VSLWAPEAQQHREVRDWFVHQSNVAAVEEVAVALPGGDTETRLVYTLETLTDSNVLWLYSLLRYLDQIVSENVGNHTTNQYFTLRRKLQTFVEGDIHMSRTKTLRGCRAILLQNRH
jgi:hypothetical protein